MHRNFSFPLLHCYSAMDVLQMQMQHCNKYQNNQDLSLPSGSDILPIYWSCRASAIYDLPINLRYIYKRVSPLVASERGGTEGFVASSQKLRFVNSLLVKRETNIFSNRFYKKCYSQTKYQRLQSDRVFQVHNPQSFVNDSFKV